MATRPLRSLRKPAFHPALDLAVFRQMADMSNDAFYLCDARGRFLYVNDRGSRMTGYSREELLAMTISDVNPEFPPRRLAEFVAALRRHPVPPFETVSRRQDGGIVPVEIGVAHLEIDGASFMFGVVRDIGERKQLEAARRSFTQRLLQMLEAERQRVARELHDDVGQAVATVGVLLHAIEQTPGSLAPDVRPALAATHASIRQVTESVARMVREYHPAELLGLGLEDTLRAHVVQFAQRHRLALELATTATAGLIDHEQELHLYRIAQEALANVARHARARRVVVRLRLQHGDLVLSIRDDGKGFAPGAADGGLGLVTMRERAALMRADLNVASSRRRGTEIRITLRVDADRSLPPAPRAVPAGSRHAGPSAWSRFSLRRPPGLERGDEPGRRWRRRAAPPSRLATPLDLEVFRRMADMSSDAFFLTDEGGRFRYVNQRGLALGGWRWEELREKTIADVNPDVPLTLYRQTISAMPPGPGMVLSVQARRKDGSFFPSEVSFARLEIDGASYAFGVARDVTERAQMQAAQRQFGQRLLEVLDAERRRLARELHEDIGRTVADIDAALATLERARGAIGNEVRPALAATRATVGQITQSVARLVDRSYPAELLGEGLEATIRRHAQEFARRHGLALRLATVSVAGALGADRELHLYRIVQEALANVARHARATLVTVHLARRRRRVVLVVVDDGSGFDAGEARFAGLGLTTMRERVAMMGGELRIRTGAGRGTAIHATLPL
ncbi:MAG: hypothetical protein B6D46_05170 [Polyangiaceae bacterium UTPRO1]|nr:PAS domain S-box protein [Myxococcales bacterium]OQY67943.1 MAG: hypothetical protein B6D46_05170 [Polyangiaceae bacterium UTPRO1]